MEENKLQEEQKKLNLLIEEDKIRREKVRMWKLSKRLGAFALTLFILFIFFKLATFFTPFLIALIIAAIIEPFIKFNMKVFKLNRKISSTIAVIITIIILIFSFIWLATFAVDKINSLIQSVGPSVADAMQKISDGEDDGINEYLSMFIPESLIKSTTEALKSFIADLGTYIKTFFQNILGMVLSVPKMIVYLVITILALILMTKDKKDVSKVIEHHFPKRWIDNVTKVKDEFFITLGNYLKVYSKIIVITFLELLISFFILNLLGCGIENIVSKSIIISIIDILPILGVGTVLIPWFIWCFIIGNTSLGIGLLIVYLVILIIRQFIEPKLVSKQLGINPLITIIAMYAGFKSIGFSGLILGPICLMILNCVFAIPIKRGLFKDLFDEE